VSVSSVAFLRNLNLGQRRSHSPTRDQLLDAFDGAALDLDTGPHAEVSFFDGPDPFPEVLPWDVPDAGLTVVRADGLHAVRLSDVERTSGATWTLERRLGTEVTSRGVPTITRLQARLRAPAGA
jgi:hypothetical protein